MDLNDLYNVMDRFECSDCVSLELSFNDMQLKLKKGGAEVTANTTVGTDCKSADKTVIRETYSHDDIVAAPLVGVFYSAPAPDKESFVSVGKRVNKGDVLCLIEAMKMMNELKSPKAGVIKEIKAANGDLVEFNSPLFVIQE